MVLFETTAKAPNNLFNYDISSDDEIESEPLITSCSIEMYNIPKSWM